MWSSSSTLALYSGRLSGGHWGGQLAVPTCMGSGTATVSSRVRLIRTVHPREEHYRDNKNDMSSILRYLDTLEQVILEMSFLGMGLRGLSRMRVLKH